MEDGNAAVCPDLGKMEKTVEIQDKKREKEAWKTIPTLAGILFSS